MVAQRDGGRAALGGFLYQIVGFVGLRAVFKGGSDGEGELAALLSVNGDVRIEHERFDSDVVVERLGMSEEAVSLIQFKFSRQPTLPPIAPSEYGKIVRALSKAIVRAKRQGKSITSCHLVTNRPCRRVDPSAFKDRKERDVAALLKVVPKIGLDCWFGALAGFGRSFGCDDREIEDGVCKLIGRVLRETTSGTPSIERTDLIGALTGHATAKPIRRDGLRARMAGDLLMVSEDLWPSGSPLPRRQWDEMSRAIFTDQHAFLVLVGDGGSGKSTGLADL